MTKKEGTIIIKRDVLSDLKRYAGTLLHEVAHASSGLPDVSREFENKLNEYIGVVACRILNDKNRRGKGDNSSLRN
jgi:hypothetical protein